MAVPVPPRSVVLVEGTSDRVALEAVAARRGIDLDAGGVRIVVAGGAHAVGRVLRDLSAAGRPARVAVLCDLGEEPVVRRVLGDDATVAVFVCSADLEDELIRGHGAEEVEAIILREGEAGPLRTFQRQPAQRGRPVEAQLRRFLGTRSGRKERYARILAEAVPADRVPAALDAALRHATAA